MKSMAKPTFDNIPQSPPAALICGFKSECIRMYLGWCGNALAWAVPTKLKLFRMIATASIELACTIKCPQSTYALLVLLHLIIFFKRS